MPSDKEIVTRNLYKIAGGASVAYVINQMIYNNVNTSTIPRKVGTYVGAFVIVSAVAERTDPIIDRSFDQIVLVYKILRSKKK